MDELIRTSGDASITQKTEGRIFQFEIKGIKEHNVCQVYGSDITDAEKYKAELDALSKFPKLNPSPVIRFNKSGIVLSSNVAANSLFGMETIEGLDIVELLPSINYEMVANCIDESHITNMIENFGEKTFKVNIRGIEELQACQIYMIDITEIEESKKKLNSYALFAKLNPGPVLRFDDKGKIIENNPAAGIVFEKDELTGEDIVPLIPELEETDIKQFINDDSMKYVEMKSEGEVYRFMLRGISELQVCHMYGSNITQRVKAELKVKEQAKHITDSINAAQKIQNALLPKEEVLDELLPEQFIFFKPRDIVSGDYYWITERGDKVIFAIADCTGHGVPGGFMSMLGISNLGQVVAEDGVETAGDILTRLREMIKTQLDQEQSESKEGMDIVLCVFDPKERQLQYAGAFNPLILIRDGELVQYKGDRMPVGIHYKEKDHFENHVIDLKSGDQVYAFSDGYTDQFGGPKNKKIGSKSVREHLLHASSLAVNERQPYLEGVFYDWKGTEEQTDDVVLMGVQF